jgi:mutual gliding-motility protein MglA
MALFNYATKEITLKIVYYGPGLSGKTTNLQYLHTVLNPETKGKLLSLSTEADRTLFFDFLPIELGKIRDFSIRFQLYTVPGQVRYNATRKVVLKGADAVVFVADSQKDMREQNIESFENMQENLISNNINPETIPIILQYNKRDLKNILRIEEIDRDLNQQGMHEVIEASAISGSGVEETFKRVTRLVLKDIAKKHKIEIQPVETKTEPLSAEKPAVPPKAVVPEPEKRAEPARVELKMREPETFSGEPIFASTSFMSSEEDRELMPEFEIEEAELIKEDEPFEAIPGPGVTFDSGRYEQEKAGEASIFAQKPVVGEPAPPVSESTITIDRTSETLQLPGQPFPDENFEALTEAMRKLSGTMDSINEVMTSLRRSIADLKGEIATLKHDLPMAKQKEARETELKDVKEFKELMREQKEISGMMKGILDILRTIKEKKSWFKL